MSKPFEVIDNRGRYTGWSAVAESRRQSRGFLVATGLFLALHAVLALTDHRFWMPAVMTLALLAWGGHRGADRYADGFRDGAHAVAGGPPEPPGGAGLVPWTDQEWADLTSNDTTRMRAAVWNQSQRQRAWERSRDE